MFATLASEDALRLSKHAAVTLLAFRNARHFTNQFSDLPGSRNRRYICLGDETDAVPAVVNDRERLTWCRSVGPQPVR